MCSILTPGFTPSFRNHSNILICCSAVCYALTSNFHRQSRGAVCSDAVAGLAVVLAAGSSADISKGVAGTRSSFPGVSRIDPVPGVVLHRRIGLTDAGQRQRAARFDHSGRPSQHRGVFGGI